MKSGDLNFLEPSGALQACNGASLPFFIHHDFVENTIIDKTLAYALETSTLTKRDRKQLNIFER